MSIRAKLILVFMLVVVVSGTNLYVYYWSRGQTDDSLEELRRATEAQGELNLIERGLNDLLRQVQIQANFNEESGSELAVRPEQIENFDTESEAIAERLKTIVALVSADNQAELAAVTAKTTELIKSWRRFYLFFGRDHVEALTELLVNGEPLATEVIQLLLPDLITKERERVAQARSDYYTRSELTGRITTWMFAGSTLVLMLAMFLFSHDLAQRLARLRHGAERIGAGELDTRLPDTSRDELGDLAQSFNAMSGRLQAARQELDEQYRKVESEHERAQGLLLNILPSSTASELHAEGKVAPQYYPQATVLFADIKGFTLATEKISADLLVQILNDYFTAFDRICDKYHVEKLKTIGDCYMAAAGVPNRRLSHCVDAILAAWEFIDAAKVLSARPDYPDWQVRVGIHTGPVIAGVVGIKKFAFDIWGSTVNRAARLEQAGAAGMINISEDARVHVKDFFDLESRGAILTKEKQGVDMYFVTGAHASLRSSEQSLMQSFAERYRVYFQESLEHLPSSMLGQAG
ncbi:MAG: adenylate/guanylate cyclase domain-containing protein [Lysobacterales bacterium]